jgi:hypothetical protein
VLSAASHVGRVGALALALGIGAAVASGAGIAHAEGPTDSDATGSAAQSSPHPSTSEGTAETPASAGSPTTESAGTDSPGVKTGRPESPNVPKMQLGNGRGAPKVDRQDATDHPGSLPELIASIPLKLATALHPHAPGGASESSTTPTAPATPRIRSASDPVTAGPRRADPTESDPPANDVADESPVTGRVTNAAATVRADVQHLVSTPTTTPVPDSAANSVAPEQITQTQATAAPANPIAMAVANVLSALGIQPAVSSTGDAPVAPPMPTLHAALQLIHREIERFALSLGYVWPTAWSPPPANTVPSIAPGVPTPADDAPTAYGDIGKWMLQSNGQISNYGGLPHGGRTLLEPVNVIIVDPTSTSAAESACKLNAAMFWSGFPAQPIHSTGFLGTIDDVTYGQQPTGLLLGFSDNFFLFPNNHGRIFGPDPVETSTGYVWSGAFSTETLVIYDFLPRHAYVSSNLARNALAMRLVASGQATYGGMVPLSNSYNTATTTTGDHDGYAVVIVLR